VVLIVVSVLVSLGFAGIMVVAASHRPLSALETILFQIVVLFAGLGGGLIGSYKFGQRAAKFGQKAAAEAARDVIRPHARSALRSVMVLNNDLLALHEPIGQIAADSSDPRIEMLHHLVKASSRVAVAAVEDWRDVIPEDFQDSEETVVQPITTEGEVQIDDSN
jgi:hypothetical protein